MPYFAVGTLEVRRCCLHHHVNIISPRKGILVTLGILEEVNQSVDEFGKNNAVFDVGNEANNWLQVVWGFRGNFDTVVCPHRAYGDNGKTCAESSETRG